MGRHMRDYMIYSVVAWRKVTIYAISVTAEHLTEYI